MATIDFLYDHKITIKKKGASYEKNLVYLCFFTYPDEYCLFV